MIYNAVNAVLTALDAQGQTDHDDWSDQLAERLASLEASYRELRNANRDLINYSDLATQAAYVFRYVLGHADFIYDFLCLIRNNLGAPIFSDEEIWVTSIGGGPGSELLGLLKYLKEVKGEPKINKIVYTVIDKESNWEHVVESFVDLVETDIDINLVFQNFDFSSPIIPEGVTLEYEELVIMSFFISEICSLPNGATVSKSLESLLSTMKDDSLLLYNDSDAYSFYTFLNGRVRGAKRFEQLLDINAEFKSDTPDYDGVMLEYVEEFDYRPKLSSKAVSKLLRRVKA